MRINNILSSCIPENSAFIPVFIDIWTAIYPNATVKVLYIADELPSNLVEYKSHIVLVNKVEDIPMDYYDTLLRLLYAGSGAYNYYETVLTTAINFLPMCSGYLEEKVEEFDNFKFIHFFDNCITTGSQEVFFNYNLATSQTYKDLFNSEMVNIPNLMKELYSEKMNLADYFISCIKDWSIGQLRTVQEIAPSPLKNTTSMIRLSPAEFDYFNDLYSHKTVQDRNDLFKKCITKAIQNKNYIDYVASFDYDKYENYTNVIRDVLTNEFKIPSNYFGNLVIKNNDFNTYNDITEKITLFKSNN